MKRLHGTPVAPDEQNEINPDMEKTDDGTGQVPDSGPLQLPDDGVAPLAPPPSPIELPDKENNLEEVYGNVAKHDPVHAAKVMDLAKRMNQPEAFIDKNLPDAEKLASAPHVSVWNHIQDNLPETHAFLSDPKNMVATHDDIPNVASHETLIKAITEAHDLTDSIKAGWQASVMGLQSRHGLPDTEMPKDASMINSLAAQAAGLAGDFTTMAAGGAAGAGIGATAGTIAGGIAGAPFAGVGAIPGAAIGGFVGAVAGGGAGAFAAPAAIKTALRLHYENGDIKSFKELLDRSGTVLKDASKQGLVGALTSLVTPMAGKFFEGTILKTMGPLAAEVGTMTTAGKAVEGELPSARDFAEGAVLVGGMHGAAHAGHYAIEGYIDNKRTTDAQNFYKALGESAEASKLRERLPPKYKELVNNITKDGPVENVHIPQEAFIEYFQSKGLDPDKVARDLGVGNSLLEARQTGGDVKIPLADWISDAGKEHYQGLARDVKFSPDDLTQNQIEARTKDVQTQMTELHDRRQKAIEANGGVDPEISFGESSEKIYNERYKQLIDAGRSDAEAKTGAKLHESLFRTYAQEAGVDPYELSQRFPLDVETKDGPTSIDGKAFNQDQPGPKQSPLGFYSQLENEVGKMDFKEMPAKDLANRIKNLSGIKAEELEHTGIQEWLAGKEGKVSKAEVQEYLKNQGVKVDQITLSKDFKGSDYDEDAFRQTDWQEPERDRDNDSDDINNELEYFGSDDYWDEESTKEIRDELAPDHTDEDGNVDEESLERAVEEEKKTRALKLAEEYVDSDDYSSARYEVKDDATGWTLSGSDEHGWYSHELGEHFDDGLEETKVQLIRHMIAKGDLAGKIADYIKPKDIEWSVGAATVRPDKGVVTRKTNALIKADKERLEKAVLADAYEGQYDDMTPEQKQKDIDQDVARLARQEVQESYDDHTNKKNTVQFDIDHELLTGRLVGNDANGYKLEMFGPKENGARSVKDYPMEAKTIDEAKTEAVKALIANKYISDDKAATEGDSTKDPNEPTGRTKFDRYTVPNGENHREVLLTLPKSSEDFVYSPHFGDQKNILAHVRLTDRVDDKGRKTLYIEEVQSDWHQQGREGGYKEKGFAAHKAEIDAAEKLHDDTLEARKEAGISSDAVWDKFARKVKDFSDENPGIYRQSELEEILLRKNKSSPSVEQDAAKAQIGADLYEKLMGDEKINALAQEYVKKNDEYNVAHKAHEEATVKFNEAKDKTASAVPNAPFKQTEAWAGLAMKRMIRMAVEQGYEAVAWTPGEVHSERWGTDNVSWKKIADGEFQVGSVEQRGGRADGVNIEELARRRGEILERKGQKVKSKNELREVLVDTLNRERNDRSLESLTDSIWKQMQEQPEGEKNPRAEGMDMFYNKMLPKVVTGILKKLDPAAKIEVGKFDTDEKEPMQSLEVPITDKLKEKVSQGQTLFQPGEDNQPRGRIKIGDDRSTIEFFKDANRSTFLHESGHYFLEVMKSLASDENASPRVKEDYQIVRDWLGIKEGEDIQTEHHEKWARGFEAYLMEGKAPSEGLRQAFSRFKQWLLAIYKSAKSLNVEISPEIREVMDRMLATSEEIKQAQQMTGHYDQSVLPFKNKLEAGKLQSLAEQARDKAETILMKEKMQEITAERKKALADEKLRLQAEAEADVSDLPVFKAQNDIQEALGTKQKVEEVAARMIDGSAKDEDAVHFEMAAEVNGFADGKDLANEILSAAANKSRSGEVVARINEGLKKHYDTHNAVKIREEAMKAVHNEKAAELLALERQILADSVDKAGVQQEVSKRNRVEARVEAEAAKAQAKEILGAKPIKDAGNSRIYVTAERNAAAKSAAAAARKDLAKASDFKRQQMLNHALASEAMKNKEQVEKSVDYLTEASKRGRDLKDMPFGFNKQVDSLLEKFGFKERSQDDSGAATQIAKSMLEKGEAPSDIANDTGLRLGDDGRWAPETLPEFISRINENYTAMILPDSVINGSQSDFKNMTMKELKDLHQAVKTVSEVGKKYDRFLNDFIQVGFKEAATELAKSIMENIGAPYAENRKIGSAYSSPWREKVANLANLPDAMTASMVNTLVLCTYLDGGKNDGPAHKYIYRPLKEAEDRKFSRYDKMREEVSGENGLFAKHYTKDELRDYKKSSFQPEVGRYLSKEQILAMALNWGNEGNRDRIRAGFGSKDGNGRLAPLSDETIKSLFKKLGKKDWDFAQATWDHLETYWPEIAKMEMKMNGVEPERVKSAPFENEHGSYKGGYYPISYDFEKSSEAFKSTQEKTELYKSYSTAAAHTDTGHTKSRVSNVNRPVRLSLDVLFNHLENVVHDLEFRPAVVDANKFLAMKDVKSSIENGVGMGSKRGLDDWLKAQGSDQSENLGFFDKAFQWTRFGTTISALGLTPKAFLLHAPSNFFQMARELGWKDATGVMTQAATDALMGRGELKQFVFERSERMKQRLTVRDRDIMDMAKAWSGEGGTIGAIKDAIPHYAFLSLHLADEAVSVPLWAEIYKRNVAEHGEAKAAALADETVTLRLGSGSKVDQIGAQRGSGVKKLFTMFYSWMSVMFNNAWLEGKLAGLEYKRGNMGAAVSIMAKASVFAFALPAIHEALLAEALRNGPAGSDDEKKKRLIGHIAEYPFANLLLARDIAPPIIHKIMGEHGGEYKMSPVEMAFQNLYSPAADGAHIAFTHGKHFDEKYAEEVARGVSQFVGYPQQINTWAFNLLDHIEHHGKDSMKDFLSRRRTK